MAWRRPGVRFPSAPQAFHDVSTPPTVVGGTPEAQIQASVTHRETEPNGAPAVRQVYPSEFCQLGQCPFECLSRHRRDALEFCVARACVVALKPQ